MAVGDFTLNDWLELSRGDPEAELRFRLILCDNASEAINCVILALTHITNQLVANRQYRQGLSEDEITIQVVEAFGYLGFAAHHDAMIGGHCDISIKMKHGVLWLAEAKIWGGCAWAFKGFRQLLTRYATGLVGQNDGALLLYSFQPNALALLQKWRAYLSRRLSLGLALGPITALHFSTTHGHPASGLPVVVRHQIVPLFWSPEDV